MTLETSDPSESAKHFSRQIRVFYIHSVMDLMKGSTYSYLLVVQYFALFYAIQSLHKI